LLKLDYTYQNLLSLAGWMACFFENTCIWSGKFSKISKLMLKNILHPNKGT